MLKKNIILLGLVIIALSFFFVFSVMEYRNIPDADWTSNYNYNSKEPYGSWLFHRLIENKIGPDNIIHRNDKFNFSNFTDSSSLYVYIGDVRSLPQEQLDSILSFVLAGNDALIIAPLNSIDLYFSDSGIETTREEGIYSNDNVSDSSDTFFEEQYNDSLVNFEYSEYGDSFGFLTSTEVDTMLVFSNHISQDSSEFHAYKHYKTYFWKPTFHKFRHFELLAETEMTYLSQIMHSKPFYGYKLLGHHKLYIHLIPELFSNVASRQKFYLDNFNFVFDQFDNCSVILDHPSFVSYQSKRISEGPLSFIMSSKSLRWAYYLLLITFLIYLINGGKRKQKVIPIKATLKNTSLDYIKTISQLFWEQDQNEKLVVHMKDNFMHTVKKKYFIDKTHSEFSDILSKKSGVPIDDIERILKKFDSAETSHFNDSQLIVFYNQIETFYKNCK